MSKATLAVSRFLKQEGEVRPMVTREELQLLLREEGGRSDINPLEQAMIGRIFRLPAAKVKEAMIPLVEVVALEESCAVGEAIASVRRENYSRYPVYRHRVDNVVGILYSLDLLGTEGEGKDIQPYIRPISFFPETKPVDELLVEMQRSQETWPQWWTNMEARWASCPSRRAARLFAAAAKLRREMGAKMSRNDRHEYEQYLDLVHEKLDHAAFEVEWSEGFSMTTEQIIKNLKEWSVNFSHDSLPQPTEMHEINVTAFMGGWHSKSYVPM